MNFRKDPDPLPETYSPELRDLCRQLLLKNPKDRPSMAEVVLNPYIAHALADLSVQGAMASSQEVTPTTCEHPKFQVDHDVQLFSFQRPTTPKSSLWPCQRIQSKAMLSKNK